MSAAFNMTDLSIDFGFGEVTFTKGIEAVPASTQVTGNVTINNSGSPAVPEFYTVAHQLSCKANDPAGVLFNLLTLNSHVFGLGLNAPYAEVEAEGARKIAPMLRAFADQIEDMVRQFDEQRNGRHS